MAARTFLHHHRAASLDAECMRACVRGVGMAQPNPNPGPGLAQAARVYCQLIQRRHASVCGVDMRGANRYHWRPDYEGVDLQDCRNEWMPLSEPQQARKRVAPAAAGSVIQGVPPMWNQHSAARQKLAGWV